MAETCFIRDHDVMCAVILCENRLSSFLVEWHKKLGVNLIFLRLLLLLCFFPSFSQATVDISEPQPYLNLSPHLDYFHDSSNELTISKILSNNSAARWSSFSSHSMFNQGLSDSTWWFKVEFINISSKPLTKLLEISDPSLDYLDVYFVIDGKLDSRYFVGDKYPFKQRVHDHRNFTFPLNMNPNQVMQMYLRVKSSSVQLPIGLWENEEFHHVENIRSLIDGAYFGALLALLLYNLIVFIFVQEKSYLFYIGFDLCAVIFCACLKGWAYQLFWPELNNWNELSLIISSAGMIFFGAMFSKFFLNLDKSHRVLNISTQLIALSAVMICLAVFVIEYQKILEITFMLMLFSCLLAMIMGVYLWASGVYEARLYTVSWIFLLLGGMTFALTKFGHLDNQWIAYYGMQIGSACEVILLSIALADRINLERSKRKDAESETVETQRLYMVRLQKEVEERTEQLQERTQELDAEKAKLQDANSKLEMLSTTDQLTGLKNRRYMDEQIAQEYERCLRYQHNLSVLLLDIDFFKKINDTYGHSCGDRCLQRVGAILRENIRQGTDFAARFGGEEFCIVLPETDHQKALASADRIRRQVEQVEVDENGKTVSFTISIGLYTLNPKMKDSIPTIIKKSGMRLCIEPKKPAETKW